VRTGGEGVDMKLGRALGGVLILAVILILAACNGAPTAPPDAGEAKIDQPAKADQPDRKSTRLNSSHDV